MALEKLQLQECMQNIRGFFDREGAFMASEQEFIHFFALPFVIEPMNHPSFKGLFEVGSIIQIKFLTKISIFSLLVLKISHIS